MIPPNQTVWASPNQQLYQQAFNPVYRHEFDALKKEVEELKILLAAAKKYDEATGQKDCEHKDKVAFLKMVADFVNVDLTEVLK